MSESIQTRTRIWNALANIKFKANYTNKCSSRADLIGGSVTFFLSATSASCVGAWVCWQEWPGLWASIVAVAQLLHIGMPHLPFVKHDKRFLEMSFAFEALYLDFEKLWFQFEKCQMTDEAAEQQFYLLREREIEIEQTHKEAHCPDIKSLMKIALTETEKELALRF